MNKILAIILFVFGIVMSVIFVVSLAGHAPGIGIGKLIIPVALFSSIILFIASVSVWKGKGN